MDSICIFEDLTTENSVEYHVTFTEYPLGLTFDKSGLKVQHSTREDVQVGSEAIGVSTPERPIMDQATMKRLLQYQTSALPLTIRFRRPNVEVDKLTDFVVNVAFTISSK